MFTGKIKKGEIPLKFLRKDILKGLVVLALIIFSFNLVWAEEKVWWIKPNVGVGPIEIAKTRVDKVLKLLGTEGTWNRKSLTLMYRKKHGLDFIFDRKTAKVTSIMISKYKVNGRVYKTKKGLHIYSPYSAIRAEYGGKPPTLIEIAGQTRFITYFAEDRFTTYVVYENRVVLIWMGIRSEYQRHIKMFKLLWKNQ